MVFVLIPTAWSAVAFFALTMCRLAALSDDSEGVALAKRIAASSLADPERVAASVFPREFRLDRQRQVFG